jgi:hypothetical protein
MGLILLERKGIIPLDETNGSMFDTTNIDKKAKNTYTARIIDTLISKAIPVGASYEYYGTTEPENFMFADGRALSRTEYAELFYVIGTTYGAGNGTTTFNIPNISSKHIIKVKDEIPLIEEEVSVIEALERSY